MRVLMIPRGAAASGTSAARSTGGTTTRRNTTGRRMSTTARRTGRRRTGTTTIRRRDVITQVLIRESEINNIGTNIHKLATNKSNTAKRSHIPNDQTNYTNKEIIVNTLIHV